MFQKVPKIIDFRESKKNILTYRGQISSDYEIPGFFPKNITPRETEGLEAPNRSETTRNRKFRQFCNFPMIEKNF